MNTTSSAVLALGGGCFWCLEGAFAALRGVLAVECGYSNGQPAPISYEAVCTGQTGCAEVVHIRYDPAQITTAQLLQVFFALHDPSTLNRQGADVGTQYRSGVFPMNAAQEEATRSAIERAQAEWSAPIVTTIEHGEWWPAEEYHQDYWAGAGQRNPYCNAVIPPKLAKLTARFAVRLSRQQV